MTSPQCESCSSYPAVMNFLSTKPCVFRSCPFSIFMSYGIHHFSCDVAYIYIYIYITYGYIKYPCVDNCVPLSIFIVKCTGVPEFPIYLSSFLSMSFNCVTIQNIENVFFKLILLCCILTCGMSLPVCVDIKGLARNRFSSSADALELPRSCAGPLKCSMYISFLSGALWYVWRVNCGISEFGLLLFLFNTLLCGTYAFDVCMMIWHLYVYVFIQCLCHVTISWNAYSFGPNRSINYRAGAAGAIMHWRVGALVFYYHYYYYY